MLLSRRELTAALAAPLVAPVGYWVGATAFGFARWLRQREEFGLVMPSVAELVRPLGLLLLVGAPVAWAAAVAGLPVYLAVRGSAGPDALGTGGRVVMLAISAALGTLVALLVRPLLGRDLFAVPFPPSAGALLGFAVGATFLWMVTRPRRT